MKKVILIVALFLGVGMANVNAQQHNKKEGCCLLVGKIWNKESCYCPGCAADARKKADAKAKEDALKLASAKQKDAENKKKALEDKKKSNEKQAAELKKRKENVLYVAAPNVGSKKTNQSETKKEKTTNASTTSKEKKGFDEANATEAEIVEWLNANKNEIDLSRSESEMTRSNGEVLVRSFSDRLLEINSEKIKLSGNTIVNVIYFSHEFKDIVISGQSVVIIVTVDNNCHYKLFIGNPEVREKFAKALRRMAVLKGSKLNNE